MTVEPIVKAGTLHIGTAGWRVPKGQESINASAGSELQRYASRLNAVEINSSFYRPHQMKTYERWASSVSESFCFALKCPKAITHERALSCSKNELEEFLGPIRGLGSKLGPLLVQLPPSRVFDANVTERFFGMFRSIHDGPIVCEPRHASWAASEAERIFVELRIARVAADPPRVPGFEQPGGWPEVRYFRWHGHPRIYFSSYSREWLDAQARAVRPGSADCWFIFDNTGLGAAFENAVEFETYL